MKETNLTHVPDEATLNEANEILYGGTLPDEDTEWESLLENRRKGLGEGGPDADEGEEDAEVA
ncbi:hypothetical protein KKA13_01880 [Patescibacteria group bacterium]|nr:hypothetical protein [Patescibacteria group bacterium]MBU1613276.1 hypothetical protein [Patescibacteria group bacterium]